MKKLLSLAAVLLAALTINAQIAATCAEAAAAMPAEKNATTAETYIVTGYITETNGTISKEQQCFWMDDEKGSKKTIQGYWCNLPEGEKDKALKVGDKITVTGKIMNYNNTPEIKNGDVAIIERAEVLPVDTITVSQALQRIKDGKLQPCAVKGKVIEPFINTKVGNAVCYWMADVENPNDSIQAFKMNGADDQKYSSLSDLEFLAGDVILVYAKALANYHDNGKDVDIPEINGGYYIRTISSDKPSEKLDWTDGLAVFFEDHWQLEISKGDKNVLLLQFSSDKETTIGGHHDLAPGSTIKVNGSEVDITSGFVKLTFKELSTEGYNVYTTQVSAITDEKVYVIANDLEFMAVRDDYETEIDLVDDRPFVPTEGQTITCEQARSYALSLADNTEGEISFTVEGYVTDLFTNDTQFWMDDVEGNAKTLLVYKYKEVSPVGVALQNGAKVKVTGKAKRYGDKPELVNGKVEIISGGGTVEVVEVTVTEAVAACQALAQNATSTETYAITGYITEIAYPYSEQYGNISFWMSDNLNDNGQVFQAYRAKCDASIADKLVPGARVKVTDKIKHFHEDAKPAEGEQAAKPERTIFETLGGGTVELLAGAGVEDIMVDVKAAKFIYEGQLYIIRNNAIYNVQGQLVK